MTIRPNRLEDLAIRLVAACLVLSWLAAIGASSVLRGKA